MPMSQTTGMSYRGVDLHKPMEFEISERYRHDLFPLRQCPMINTFSAVRLHDTPVPSFAGPRSIGERRQRPAFQQHFPHAQGRAEGSRRRLDDEYFDGSRRQPHGA